MDNFLKCGCNITANGGDFIINEYCPHHESKDDFLLDPKDIERKDLTKVVLCKLANSDFNVNQACDIIENLHHDDEFLDKSSSYFDLCKCYGNKVFCNCFFNKH